MRIYIFKSETRKDLRAFAADLAGSKLPQNHGPWTATGAIGPHNAPPHNFSRAAIEQAIDAEGFQLWHGQEDRSQGLKGSARSLKIAPVRATLIS